MAENKKSFLLYADIEKTLDKLPDEVAGKLFKTIVKYVNDRNPDVSDDYIVDIVFEPIKQQLKRDLVKYEERRKKLSEYGKLGGRPKTEDEEKAKGSLEKPKVIFEEKTKAKGFENTEKKPVNVNVNVNVLSNDNIACEGEKQKLEKTIRKYDLHWWQQYNGFPTTFTPEMQTALEMWFNHCLEKGKPIETTGSAEMLVRTLRRSARTEVEQILILEKSVALKASNPIWDILTQEKSRAEKINQMGKQNVEQKPNYLR